MTTPYRCLMGLGLAWTFTANAAEVTTEYDHGTDFAAVKTYGWRPGRMATRNPALDNELTAKNIRTFIDDQLRAKGLVQVDRNPDVWVTYRVGTGRAVQTDVYPAGWRGWGTRVVKVPATAGSLVIDLLNGGTRELVWRSITTDVVSDPQKFEERLGKDIKEAFKRYPPKK